MFADAAVSLLIRFGKPAIIFLAIVAVVAYVSWIGRQRSAAAEALAAADRRISELTLINQENLAEIDTIRRREASARRLLVEAAATAARRTSELAEIKRGIHDDQSTCGPAVDHALRELRRRTAHGTGGGADGGPGSAE